MRCEACGYQFLLASSTKCPDCGDLREAIVAMNDSVLSPGTAAQETAKQFMCAGNSCKYLSECNEAQECQIALQRTAAQCGYGFLTANAPSNAYTEPQGAPKRPFEQVAGTEGFDIASQMVISSLQGRIQELESYSHELAVNLDKRNAKEQETEAYRYLSRLFRHLAPQCTVFPDMLGLCTQIDNVIAGLQIEVAKSAPPAVGQIPITESVVGLKAANAHLTRRVAELEAEKSRRDIVAQNIPPATGLPPLGAEAWREIAMAYRAEIDDLTRQLAAQPQLIEWSHISDAGAFECPSPERIADLQRNRPGMTEEMILAGIVAMRAYEEGDDAGEIIAVWDAMNAVAPNPRAVPYEEYDKLTRQLAAQALAHAEQMENVGAKAAKMLLAKNFRIAKLEAQLAMRVTPATQPTNAQQTAGDAKATQEPKAFPAGALKTGGSDPRRMGP